MMVPVVVDTETGRQAALTFDHDLNDTYTLRIAGELIDIAPEGVTAAVQVGVLELRRRRQAAGKAHR